VLYRLIAGHLETFLAQAREAYQRGLPRYVEQELRAYLACGIHAHGFIRTRCSDCHKELLIAFSCKRRGVCPSCNARRMCGTAAHLTDRVLPDVPLRQWVLSVPFELRLLLAKNAAALSAVGRIFVQEILRWQREQALRSLPAPPADAPTQFRGGAICFPQRFGGSLNLNVHYHVAVPDGVFTRCPSGGAQFHRLPLPNRSDLDAITHAVELRALRWLKRRGLLSDARDTAADQEPAPSALDALPARLARRRRAGGSATQRCDQRGQRPAGALGASTSAVPSKQVSSRLRHPRGRLGRDRRPRGSRALATLLCPGASQPRAPQSQQ
jgi:hypothetical protein